MATTSATESAMSPHAWADGSWTNAPESVTEDGDGALHVEAREGSDAWRITSYGFINDTEHALLAPIAPGSSVEVEFGTPFSQQFDQAGVFLRASATQWVKAGIEYADGAPRVGAVVTNGASDWSTTAVPEWAGERVVVRVSWDGAAVTVRARSVASEFQLVRVAPFETEGKAAAGPFVCAPTRSGLVVPFYSWSSGSADASLH